MPNWLDSAREFLGLGHDPYYDDFEDEEVSYGDDGSRDSDSSHQRSNALRPIASIPAESDTSFSGRPNSEDDAGVRMIGTSDDDRVPPRGPVTAQPASMTASSMRDRAVVMPIATSAKPDVVTPTVFDDSRAVADAVKQVQPVILNLQGVDRDLARRLIDFASGLSYGLDVEMERVAKQVFLLTPKGADVSADDRKRLEEGRLSEYAD